MSKKENKFWQSNFGVASPLLVPESIKRLPWKDENVTDEDLGFLCSRLKSIYQMDLDNCYITIQKIPGLKLLYIGGTNISSEGIGKLSSLSTLETLICTPDPIDPIRLRKFKNFKPDWELIIKYKAFKYL